MYVKAGSGKQHRVLLQLYTCAPRSCGISVPRQITATDLSKALKLEATTHQRSSRSCTKLCAQGAALSLLVLWKSLAGSGSGESATHAQSQRGPFGAVSALADSFASMPLAWRSGLTCSF